MNVDKLLSRKFKKNSFVDLEKNIECLHSELTLFVELLSIDLQSMLPLRYI